VEVLKTGNAEENEVELLVLETGNPEENEVELLVVAFVAVVAVGVEEMEISGLLVHVVWLVGSWCGVVDTADESPMMWRRGKKLTWLTWVELTDNTCRSSALIARERRTISVVYRCAEKWKEKLNDRIE
jgi:hypothetical protein